MKETEKESLVRLVKQTQATKLRRRGQAIAMNEREEEKEEEGLPSFSPLNYILARVLLQSVFCCRTQLIALAEPRQTFLP